MFGGIILGFFKILESYIVIDNKRVQTMRESIFIENPLMTSQERSRMLIHQIHKTINSNLDGITPEMIPKIRTLILKRSIKDTGILVTYSDIIHSIAELDLPLEDTIDNIKAWYELHLRGSSISIIDLIDYIKSIQIYQAPVEISETIVEEVYESLNLPPRRFYYKKSLVVLCSIGLIALLISVFINDDTVETNGIAFGEKSISFANAQELLPISTTEAGYFNELIDLNDSHATAGIPEFLKYHAVDRAALQAYLRSRNSILADAPYFEGILKVSEEYDLHPLLMFAITGQEQGYVNKENPNHLKIANNPFNVYTSWRKYNTNIEDSTAIAAGTVITILRKRPADKNPFRWINTRYAEDENWARGVEMIFNFLRQFEL